MESETPQSTRADTEKAPPSTNASPAGAAPSATGGDTRAPLPRNTNVRRSTLVIGSVAILALGMFLGIGAARYVTGIPRAAAATAKGGKNMPPLAALPPAQQPRSPSAWNPFQELRDMQLHMDQMFDDMASQFRLEPRLNFTDNPGYSLSLRVQDLKDRFEVRAHLPNAKASDVNVSLLGKQTLKVEVTNKTAATANQKAAKEEVTEWGQYAQIIQLPAPVKSEEMKIDQSTHELIVTLPKA